MYNLNQLVSAHLHELRVSVVMFTTETLRARSNTEHHFEADMEKPAQFFYFFSNWHILGVILPETGFPKKSC